MEAIESCGPKLIPNEAELPVEANETSPHFEENRKEKLENGNVVDENEALNLAGMEDQMESVELDDPETDVAAAKTGKSLVEHGSSVEPEAGPSLMQVDAPIVSIEAGMDLDSPSNGTVVVPSNETIVQVPDLGQLLFPAAPPSTIDRLIEEE